MSEKMQRRYIALLCLHGEEHLGTGGDGDYTEDEIRRALGISRRALAETKTLFLELGFMDETWKFFNFSRLQLKSDNSAERVKRHRASKRISEKEENVTLQNRYCNGDVTVQNRAEEEQNRKEQSESREEQSEEQSHASCDAVPVLPGSPSDEETMISRYRRAFEEGMPAFEAGYPTINFEREWASFVEPKLRKNPDYYASIPESELHAWFLAWWERALRHYKPRSSRATEEMTDAEWDAYAKETNAKTLAALSAEPPPTPPPPETETCPECGPVIAEGRFTQPPIWCRICGGAGVIPKHREVKRK